MYLCAWFLLPIMSAEHNMVQREVQVEIDTLPVATGGLPNSNKL